MPASAASGSVRLTSNWVSSCVIGGVGVVWEADGQRVIEKSTGYGMLGAKGAKSGESRSRAAGDRGAIACGVKLARGTRGVGMDACARRIRAWIS